MKNILSYTFLFCILNFVNAQDINTFKNLIQFANLEETKLVKECPNFPIDGTSNDLQLWIKNFEKEVLHFMNISEIKNINPSYIDLKIEYLKPYVFKHYLWGKYNKLPKEKKKLVTHMPQPVLTGNLEVDFNNYDVEIAFWKIVYTPEFVTLNKYFNPNFEFQYQPKFIGKIVTIEKPLLKDFSNKTDFYLTLQNWYFVYEYESFKKVFGYTPNFLIKFDEDEYRYKIMNPEMDEDEKN